MRTFSLELLDLFERRMREMTEQMAGAFELTAQFEFRRNPPTIQPRRRNRLRARGADRHGGRRAMLDFEPTMGAEDFSYYLLRKPGLLLPDRQWRRRPPPAWATASGPCTLHNPGYDFNDELIPLGGSSVGAAGRSMVEPLIETS